MRDIGKMYFSQAALSAWLSCRLKFKYRYIEGLFWPLPPEAVGKLEPGRKFHLVAQQYYQFGHCHLPPQETELASLVEQLKRFLPAGTPGKCLPEFELRCQEGEMRLLAKYDLLVQQPQGVTIYDWKTDHHAPQPNLLNSPQTRLYLYLLSSVPGYFALAPEQVEMIYWNPRFPQEPRTTRYNSRQRSEDGQWLRDIITEIKANKHFPGIQGEPCRRCEYRPVCHGRGIEFPQEDNTLEVLDWDFLPELVWGGS
jgi:hypothetical protein